MGRQAKSSRVKDSTAIDQDHLWFQFRSISAQRVDQPHERFYLSEGKVSGDIRQSQLDFGMVLIDNLYVYVHKEKENQTTKSCASNALAPLAPPAPPTQRKQQSSRRSPCHQRAIPWLSYPSSITFSFGYERTISDAMASSLLPTIKLRSTPPMYFSPGAASR